MYIWPTYCALWRWKICSLYHNTSLFIHSFIKKKIYQFKSPTVTLRGHWIEVMSQLLSSEVKVIRIDSLLFYLFRQSDKSVVAYGALGHSVLWGKEKQQGRRIVLEMSMRNSRLDCTDILLFPRVVLGANTLLNSQRYETHTHTHTHTQSLGHRPINFLCFSHKECLLC